MKAKLTIQISQILSILLADFIPPGRLALPDFPDFLNSELKMASKIEGIYADVLEDGW